MANNTTWEIPEGFQYHYHYPDGHTPTPTIGYLYLESANLLFYMGEKEKNVPVLPLKNHGQLWHTGWDIPTNYAIDANNQVWMNDAHGGGLELASPDRLIGAAEDAEERRRLQKILGLKINLPEWIICARLNGWTPPPGWKDPE